MAPNATDSFVIEGGDLVLPDCVILGGVVVVSSGEIVYAGHPDRMTPGTVADGRKISAAGRLVCPALWEHHLHGCGGNGTEDMTPEALLRMADFLAQRGVGVFLPTAVPGEDYLRTLGATLSDRDIGHSLDGRVPGIHLEGPFVAHEKRGGIPEELVQPISADRLEELLTLTNNQIRVLTYAPELPGSDWLFRALSELDILPSFGHSDARFQDVTPYDEATRLSVTHLFNGMSGVSHKEPGLAHWALLNRGVSTELICDGVHVQDPAVLLALRSRPLERIVVVSDAIAPAGLVESEAPGGASTAATGPTLYQRPLEVRGAGFYYAGSGTLVGSSYLVNDGLARLVGTGMVSLPRAVAMATLNPARLHGYAHKGALLAGYDADVAVFTRDLRRCDLLAWQGKILHERRL